MNNEQPEALYLAERLEMMKTSSHVTDKGVYFHIATATELRRQYAEITRLQAALDDAQAKESVAQMLAGSEATPLGITANKLHTLIAEGREIVGWLLAKPGDRYALMRGPAVRWIEPSDMDVLMHTEGSRIVAGKPLTDEQMLEALDDVPMAARAACGYPSYTDMMKIARAVEAAHSIGSKP